ncbi:MAG: signal transduction histidine kinase [Sulfitobacter sp.]|jgi:signal transduction histidine kinase
MQSHPVPPAPDEQSQKPETTGASQDIEDFIYLISHDVRSSVRALLELPNWISEDLVEAGFTIDGSVATSIELMNRHTSRLDRMLVDLLTFSRIGRMQRTEEMSLQTMLDQVLGEVDLPAGFTLTQDIQGAMVTMGNRDILTLFSALIVNAFRHHDKKTGRIHISAHSNAEAVVINVADDGPGIPDEFHDRVFKAMITLRPRDEVEGSGMGLANVQKIAGLYGGEIRLCASPFGRGCNVEVRLPARKTSAQ